jgi:hypothetical protein
MEDLNLEVLRIIQDKYNMFVEEPRDQNYIDLLKRELYVIKRVIGEKEWSLLPCSLKQESRKNSIELMIKWASEDGTKIDISYEQSVVVLYDTIELLIDSIKTVNKSEILLRLSTILLIEKYFIDQYKDMRKIRHNDYYIFMNILNLIAENYLYEYLQIDSLINCFDKMYKLWPDRPYKEVTN